MYMYYKMPYVSVLLFATHSLTFSFHLLLLLAFKDVISTNKQFDIYRTETMG